MEKYYHVPEKEMSKLMVRYLFSLLWDKREDITYNSSMSINDFRNKHCDLISILYSNSKFHYGYDVSYQQISDAISMYIEILNTTN